MNRESQLLNLLGLVYQAAVEPGHWAEFVASLSAVLDGAAITLAFTLGDRKQWEYYSAGLAEPFGDSVARRFVNHFPWQPSHIDDLGERFRNLGELFPDTALEETDFFREWMAPRGLPPRWPIAHTIRVEGAPLLAWITAYARRGEAPLDTEARRFADRLVPHLKRAFQIYADLDAIHHERRVLDEVIDRLQIGVILTDAEGRPVFSNLSAQRMLALEDGIGVVKGRLRGADPKGDGALQAALNEVIDAAARDEFHRSSLTTVSSTSGRRPFQISVNPLLGALPGSPAREAVTVVFIGAPDAVSAASVQVLRALYRLTAAETELVQLLADGASLDEAARKRGVTVATARSQLKNVFSKTGVRRQVELVQLVLAGVASVHGERPGGSRFDPK